MTDGGGPRSGETRLQKQAREILEEGMDIVDLVSQLDFGYIKSNDEYAE